LEARGDVVERSRIRTTPAEYGKRAVIAVARKLAVLLHRLWVSGEVYQPLRVADSAGLAA
jgi:hypothetical protein